MESVFDNRTPFVRLVAILLTALFVLSLVPILAAARYAAPESDDLLYGQDAHDALAQSPTLSALLGEAAAKVAHHHQVAHGRYANTFLGAAFLGAFGIDHYWSVPVLMLLMLIMGTMLFSYALLVRVLHADKWTWLAISSFVLLFCVQLLPSPAEGLFWFCGGLGYTLYYSVSLVLLSLLLFTMTGRSRARRIVCGLLAVLLSAIVAGLGFTVMLILAAAMLGYIVLAITKKRWDMCVIGILTLAVFAAGTIIQLTAPATAVRAAWEQEMYGYTPSGPVKAVLLSFLYALCTLLHRVDGGMLLFIALVALLLAPYLQESGYRFRMPLLVLAASFCLYATMFTASLYSTSSMGPYRQWNVMYFAMFPFFGVNAAYCTGWCLRRMEKCPDGEPRWQRLRARTNHLLKHRLAAVLVMACLMLSSVIINGVYETTSVAALREVLNGSAQARYTAYTQERFDAQAPAERDASRLYLY